MLSPLDPAVPSAPSATTPVGDLLLAGRGTRTHVICEGIESSAVRLAAGDLTEDLMRLVPGADVLLDAVPLRTPSARETELVSQAGPADQAGRHAQSPTILVGTAGVSAWVDAATADGLVDLAPLRDEHGGLRWEGFVVVPGDDGVLRVVGADRRGTVFGVYRVAELLGVSPWRFWADVPVATSERVAWRHGGLADWPAVRFRGIFLNDEELLEQWAVRHTGDATIGPETYSRIAELILRLGGNYLWPAMHVNAFNHDPANARVVHERGVVVGTSHCDMLLRSNQHEWAPWVAERGYDDAEYDFSIPGTNRERVLEYWRGSIAQNRDYDVTWTLGMRGIHDSGFVTRAIDEDPSLDAAARHRARVALLGDVVAEQRRLLREELGERACDAVTTFVPYKEVLPLYDDGLDLPEDVTIMWSDDNFGYVRRLPGEQERARSGGNGLYYHSSYWAHPGMSYLYLGGSALALMAQQLERAWTGGIRTIWVDNVGALKPLELETELFLRAAWRAGRPDAITADSVDAHLRAVLRRDLPDLGDSGSDEAAELLLELGRLLAIRRVEHLTDDVLDVGDVRDDAAVVLERFERLADRFADLAEVIHPERQDAAYQLVGRRVLASWLLFGHYSSADRSRAAFADGRARSADAFHALSRRYRDAWRELNHHEEHTLAGGRWSGVVQPERFPPPTTARFPASAPALRVGDPHLAVSVVGHPDHPDHSGQPAVRPIRLDRSACVLVDVVNTGRGTLRVRLEARGLDVCGAGVAGRDGEDGADGVLEVTSEHRVAASLAEGFDAGELVAVDESTGRRVVLTFAAATAIADPCAQPGDLLESGGVVSVPASAVTLPTGSAWAAAPALGRLDSRALIARPTTDAGPGRITVVLGEPGDRVLELSRLPTLSSTGRLRVAVSVDDGAARVLESENRDEWVGSWRESALGGIETLVLPLGELAAGRHALDLHAVDDGVVLLHAVVRRVDTRRGSVPPPVSRRVGDATRTDSRSAVVPGAPWQPSSPSFAALGRLRALGAMPAPPAPAELRPPEIVAGLDFVVSRDPVFDPNPTRADRPAEPPPVDADGAKDVLARLGRSLAREDREGVRIEVEDALLGTSAAWLSPAADGTAWEHTDAESEGGGGLALRIPPGRTWDEPDDAPGIHHRVQVEGGRYVWWALVWVDGDGGDSVHLAVDGRVLTLAECAPRYQGRSSLWTYGTEHAWHWRALCEVDLAPGRHVLSVLAHRSGVRLDRLYLASDGACPPSDHDWRRGAPAPAVPTRSSGPTGPAEPYQGGY